MGHLVLFKFLKHDHNYLNSKTINLFNWYQIITKPIINYNPKKI